MENHQIVKSQPLLYANPPHLQALILLYFCFGEFRDEENHCAVYHTKLLIIFHINLPN